MKKFAILGSCLTNIPGVFLGNEYSWNRLNNAVVPSAKHFVDYYIDGTRTMPPLGDLIGEFRLENPALTAEDRECITEWVTENYRDHIGLRGLPKSQPNLFENLENEVFDAILFDNLLDLRIPYWNYVGNNLPPFSFTFPVKDKRVPHIHDDFVEAPRPTPTEAADDWMRIVDYVRERQPSARLFFFCAPVVTNEGRPALQQAAWEFYLRFSTLARSRELVDIMAAVASEVRLARFLIQHSRRMADCGQSPRRFLLRMGRREISSMLGVAHETVSRSFTALSSLGLVQVCAREVEILDMDGLGAFARSTRRQLDAPVPARARTPAHSLPAQGRHAHTLSLAA